MCGSHQGEQQTHEEVVPGMREHRRKEIAAHERNDAEHSAKCTDEAHAAQTLITVRKAEDDGAEKNAERNTMQKRDALRLQIATKDELFREADDEAERAPCGNLETVGGSEIE